MSIFLKIDGVGGEASDKNHQGWIDILKLKWGVRRKITSHSGTCGNRESSNAVVSDLTIIHRMDVATPKLFLESCCGRGRDMVIHLTQTGQGDGAHPFMAYQLKHALISGYRIKAHKDDIHRPNEEIRISFTDINVRYTPYDDEGMAQAPLSVGFNTATNIKA